MSDKMFYGPGCKILRGGRNQFLGIWKDDEMIGEGEFITIDTETAKGESIMICFDGGYR